MYSWKDKTFRSDSRSENTVFHQLEKINIIRRSGLGFGVRHVQCLMVFFGWGIAYSLRINLSLAIVSMTKKGNGIETAHFPVLPWDEPMQGAILSSFFWGYIFLQLPGGQLADRFGPKVLFTTSIFLSGILTVLTPYAATHGGYYWMISTRVLMGLSQGVLFPTMALFLSKWAPTPERGRICCFVLSGNQLGNLMTLATAGILADSRWGWPSIFYVTGGTAILWALLYTYIGSSSPQDHTTISESEKAYILSSLPNSTSDRSSLNTPWREIFTSPPVWASIIGYFSDCWGFFILHTQIPRYISGALGVKIKNNGFFSALPYASSLLSSLLFGPINDVLVNKSIFTPLASRRFWNSVALWGGAIALGLLAFSGNHESLAVLLLTVSMFNHSGIYLGVTTDHIDLCPNFSGTLMGIQSVFGTVAGSLGPLYTGFIVSDVTSLAQWRIIFLTSATIFFIGISVKVQPWNFPTEKQDHADTQSRKEEEKGALENFENQDD